MEEMNSPALDAIDLIDLNEAFDRLAPEEWKNLPMAFTTTVMDPPTDTQPRRVYETRACVKKCAGPVPSDSEIEAFVEHIKNTHKPTHWLYHLGYLQLVNFPEDHDPTVKDFFDGNYDPSKASLVAALLSYPLVEI
jgi:hypothetical protein